MSNTCPPEDRFSALLDNELRPHEADRLHHHMEKCADCRQRMDTLKQTDAMIRDLPQTEPSVQFDRTFWAKVEEMDHRRAKRNWWHALFSAWKPIAAGALVGGLAVAIFIYSGMEQKMSSEEIFLAENVELLETYEIIEHLEMLENWDVIDLMEERS